MDHGVSTYPQDGEQREQLIRVARRTSLRRKNRTTTAGQTPKPPRRVRRRPLQIDQAKHQNPRPPQPSLPFRRRKPPIEMAATPQATAPVPEPPVSPAPTEVAPIVPPPPSPPVFAATNLTALLSRGIRGTATLHRASQGRTRFHGGHQMPTPFWAIQPLTSRPVVDLGFGGVALDFPSEEAFPDTLLPFFMCQSFRPVRVNLFQTRLDQASLSEKTRFASAVLCLLKPPAPLHTLKDSSADPLICSTYRFTPWSKAVL